MSAPLVGFDFFSKPPMLIWTPRLFIAAYNFLFICTKLTISIQMFQHQISLIKYEKSM